MGYYENLINKSIARMHRDTLEKKLLYEDALMRLPEGELRTKKKKGRIYYTNYSKGKHKYITKDAILVNELKKKPLLRAQATYYDDAIRIIDEMMTALESLCPYEKDLLAQNWMENKEETNPFNKDALKYMTDAGIYVRSKSERTIADWLTRYKLPFKYEIKMDCAGHIMYPDFIIRKANGEIVIWEHFGLMSNPEYYYRAMEKIRYYRELGFVQHKNLICTWEEDLTEPREIQRIIETFLL